MSILVAHPLHPDLIEGGLGERVIYRPELAQLGDDALIRALIELCPTAVSTEHPPSSTALLQVPSSSADSPRLQWRYRSGSPQTGASPEGEPGVYVERTPGTIGHLGSDLRALGDLERALTSDASAARLVDCGITQPRAASLAGARVTLVGAGIVNLIVARQLIEHGASVRIIDAGPDPRRRPHWQRLGATHGGGNGRMFCATEADSFNVKPGAGKGAYRALNRQISQGGWLIPARDALTAPERTWIDTFGRLPPWCAEIFAQDIRAFNITGGMLWQTLRDQCPRLFDGVDYLPGVLRVYSQPEKLAAAEALHRRLGALVRALDRAALGRRHPALQPAVASGELAGGLEIQGFTLKIHHFADRLLTELEDRGAQFHWQLKATSLQRNADGHVEGVVTADGLTRCEHLVLAPGGYGNPLLQGTRSEDKIQGIVGLWLSLPNPQPGLRCSIKIHCAGRVAEDSNVIVCRDDDDRPIMILGSGYGFIGNRAVDLESAEISRLFEALEHNARRFLPTAFKAALDSGTPHRLRRACIRPFTATGLGIFEVDRTAEGGRLVIASGHNTGGFTQAPAVAEAVVATLGGARHPMQDLYDPERGAQPAP